MKKKKLTVARLRKGGTFEVFSGGRWRRMKIVEHGYVADVNGYYQHHKTNVWYQSGVRNLRQPRRAER